MPDRLTRIKRRLMAAFEFKTPDETDLTASILRQRSETWRSTLTEEARLAGSFKVGQGPTGRDFEELSRMARADAASIVQTFNRELEHQIERLYAANPDGDRAYYIRELTTWADRRADYKDRQIANQNRATTRMYAQQRFNEMNRVGEALYLFTGPPPREPICADHFAAGVVNAAYVEAHPTPIHINCPHDWVKQSSRVGVPLAQLWVGE